jgi:hypothetical protein
MGDVVYLLPHDESPSPAGKDREKIANSIRAALEYFLRDAEDAGLAMTVHAIVLAQLGLEEDLMK